LLVYGIASQPTKAPWYTARLVGADAMAVMSKDTSIDDARLLIAIDVWVTAAHLMLPIRVVAIRAVQIASIVSHPAWALMLGTPMKPLEVIMNCGAMSLLTFAAAWGRSTLQLKQRAAYIKMARERTLRTVAEHELHCAKVDSVSSNDTGDKRNNSANLVQPYSQSARLSSVSPSATAFSSLDREGLERVTDWS